MKPVQIDGRLRHKVYPGRDERILRVVRKVIRGLSHHHGLLSPVSDERVSVDILLYPLKREYIDVMEYHHREEDIAEYMFEHLDKPPVHSFWLLSFFQKVNFIGLISTSPDQKVRLEQKRDR
jgi:hypothetical protein